MILLVTNKRDITMDYIVVELRKRGIKFFRLNTEDLPKSYSIMSDKSLMDWSIELHGNTLKGSDVKSAYFRRPGKPEAPSNICDKNVIEYIECEWNSFLKSLYMRLDCMWFSSPTNIMLAEDKPRQLLLAKKIGFDIPESIITNSPEEINKINSCLQVIGKPLRQSLLISNQTERIIFTNRLGRLDYSDSEALSLVPIIIQREIIKKFDIRVTVVGKEVFAAAIFSQENVETTVDWRKGSRTDLKHEPIELPVELKSKCIELVESLNLRFGAIDLVCDKNDQFWFLEINPNGQWAWIENQTKLPIASAIADELLRIGGYEL